MEHGPRIPQQLHNVHTELALLIILTSQIGEVRMLKVTANSPKKISMLHQECSLLFITPVHTPSAIVYGGASQDDSDSLCGSVEVGNSQGLSICGPTHKEHNYVLRPGVDVCVHTCA